MVSTCCLVPGFCLAPNGGYDRIESRKRPGGVYPFETDETLLIKCQRTQVAYS